LPYWDFSCKLLSTGSRTYLIVLNRSAMSYSLIQVCRQKMLKVAISPVQIDLRRLPIGVTGFSFAVNKRNKTLSMLTSKYIGRQPQVWIVDMKVKL
jgi:hypothetical protein